MWAGLTSLWTDSAATKQPTEEWDKTRKLKMRVMGTHERGDLSSDLCDTVKIASYQERTLPSSPLHLPVQHIQYSLKNKHVIQQSCDLV